MTRNESVNKCVRLAADSIERWGASPAQVESAIEKAILLAIEEEREACAKIGDDRIKEINRTYPAQPGSSTEWHEKATRLTEANHYRSMIRARSS